MKFNLQSKLGAWALIALLCFAVVPTVGCNGTTAAQNIINWVPPLEAAVNTVDGTAALLDPANAPIFVAATVGFDAAATILVNQAKAYLANPNVTVLAQLQTAVLTFQSSINASVLAAAKITNAASQAKALNSINGVATIVTAILALITTIKGATVTPASVTAPTLSQVLPFLDQKQSIAIVARHYNEPQFVVAYQVNQAEAALVRAGF